MRASLRDLLLSLLFLPACSPGGDGAARRLEEEGRWAEAALLHRKEALRLGPRRGDESVKRAMAAFLMADRLPDAESFAAELLALDPGRTEVLYYLGDSQRVLMRYEGARSTLKRLLELDPGHRGGTLALGHVLLRLGEPGKALPLFERVLAAPGASEVERGQAEIERARALRRLGREREAADALATVLERDPHHPVALSEAAQTFFLLRKEDLAKALREKYAWLSARGHQLSGEDETLLYPREGSPEGGAARRALQAADRREFLAALEGLSSLAASGQGDPAIAFAHARLWQRLQRFEESLRVLDAALERGGEGLPGLHSLRAEALRGLGRSGEARAAHRRASSLIGEGKAVREAMLGLSPLESLLSAGILEMEPGGDPERARAFFERARTLAPGDPRPILARARLALERDGLEEARALLALARERGGEEHPEVRRMGAVLAGLGGDLRTAAREIMDLIRRRPGDLSGFQAFERVFGTREGEPEVARVLAMKKALEEKLAAREAAIRSLSAKPFRACAPEYLRLGDLSLEVGSREEALDFFLLAAELDPAGTSGLRRAEAVLSAPGEVFLRLHALKGILERSPGDEAAAMAIRKVRADLQK